MLIVPLWSRPQDFETGKHGFLSTATFEFFFSYTSNLAETLAETWNVVSSSEYTVLVPTLWYKHHDAMSS